MKYSDMTPKSITICLQTR